MDYVDVNSISELHEFVVYPPPVHPLVTVIDFARVDRSRRKPGEIFYRLGVYGVSCKRVTGRIKYGRSDYDFSEGDRKSVV